MCNLVEIRLSCELDSWFRPERFEIDKFNNTKRFQQTERPINLLHFDIYYKFDSYDIDDMYGVYRSADTTVGNGRN